MWQSKIVPGYSPDGTPILSIIAKETYKFENGKTAVVDEDNSLPLYEDDVYSDIQINQLQLVQHESDMVAFKPMTDVVFHGKAYAPLGKRARFFDVIVAVQNVVKKIRVIGDRKLTVYPNKVDFTEPELFSEMPLDLSRAYGGVDSTTVGLEYIYQKNLFGRGFAVQHNPEALVDILLPNLEDPNDMLSPDRFILKKYDMWKQWPSPASLGYVPKQHYPRYTYGGLPPESALDAEIQRLNSLDKMEEVGTGSDSQPGGPVPIVQPQFFNGASDGLQIPYLSGNEHIGMMYMDPVHPKFKFTLPGQRPEVWLDVGEGKKIMKTVLQTVEVYKETNQVTLLWRGSCYYGGPEKMKEFERFEHGIVEN